jgi:hypothetical protein
MEALKAFSLAVSRLSCSVSFSICSLSLSICSLSLSICSLSLSICSLYAPQLCDLALDEQNIALDLLRSLGDSLHPPFVLHLALLVMHHAQLVAGIATPVEHRQKLSPPR